MPSLISVNNTSNPSLRPSSKHSKKSRSSGSFRSVHGSKFGRSVSHFTAKGDVFNTNTTSTANSRVIPTFFGSNLNGTKLPNVVSSTPTKAIRELGQKLDIVDYEFNYVSFWLLDVFTKVLKEIQVQNISNSLQIVFLSWLRFVLRSISLSGSTREEMFTFLQDIFVRGVSIIEDGKPIPLPEDVSITSNNEVSQEISSQLSKLSSTLSNVSDNVLSKKLSRSLKSNSNTSKRSKVSSGKSSKSSSQTTMESLSSEDRIAMNLNIFHKIVETLYEIFADRYIYKLIASAYSSPVALTLVDVQVDFNEPKQPKPEPIIPVVIESPRTGKKLTRGSKGKRKVKTLLLSEGGKKVKKSKKKPETSTEPTKKGVKGKKSEQGKDETRGTDKSDKKGKGKKGVKSTKSAAKSSIPERQSVKEKKTSIDERKIILENRMKMFDRKIYSETEKELKEQNRNYLVPLSEAVGDDFVKNLIKPLMPEEKDKPAERKPNKKKKKKTSIKSKGKKEKSKKKKK